jgi:hypothetical protein
MSAAMSAPTRGHDSARLPSLQRAHLQYLNVPPSLRSLHSRPPAHAPCLCPFYAAAACVSACRITDAGCAPCMLAWPLGPLPPWPLMTMWGTPPTLAFLCTSAAVASCRSVEVSAALAASASNPPPQR